MSEWRENIPDDWDVKRLEDIAVVDSEVLPENTDPQYEFSYISISDIGKGKILNNVERLTFKNAPSRARRILKGRDVLLSTVRPNLQAFCLMGDYVKDYIASTGFAVLSARDGYSSEYLYHYLYTDHFTKQINNLVSGSNYPAINSTEAKKLEICIPQSDKEQRKIAKILSIVDSVIEKTGQTIEKYKAIKQGMMHDLFTRGLDKNGKLRPRYDDAPHLYKKTELGWLPKAWDVKALEEITDYVDYRGKTPPKSEYGIFLITARNIKEGYIDYDVSKEYIPEYAYESAMSRGKAAIGDVLITTEAPMGNVAQIDKEFIALAQRVIKYRGKKDLLLNDYLAINLMSEQFHRRLIAESTGSTVLGIKGSRLHRIKICLPKTKEQFMITKIVKTIEKMLKQEEFTLSNFSFLKQALMQDLLTGRKRVKVENELENTLESKALN
jgi:type I restriction enzyme, S subunit